MIIINICHAYANDDSLVTQANARRAQSQIVCCELRMACISVLVFCVRRIVCAPELRDFSQICAAAVRFARLLQLVEPSRTCMHVWCRSCASVNDLNFGEKPRHLMCSLRAPAEIQPRLNVMSEIGKRADKALGIFMRFNFRRPAETST